MPISDFMEVKKPAAIPLDALPDGLGTPPTEVEKPVLAVEAKEADYDLP